MLIIFDDQLRATLPDLCYNKYQDAGFNRYTIEWDIIIMSP